jgi:hypothetical protein
LLPKRPETARDHHRGAFTCQSSPEFARDNVIHESLGVMITQEWTDEVWIVERRYKSAMDGSYNGIWKAQYFYTIAEPCIYVFIQSVEIVYSRWLVMTGCVFIRVIPVVDPITLDNWWWCTLSHTGEIGNWEVVILSRLSVPICTVQS